MSIDSPQGRVLSMLKSLQFEGEIELKAKKHLPFVALVTDFKYDVETNDTFVTFTRTQNTVFPTDTAEVKPDTYVIPIKNIKDAHIFKPNG